jgi:hypothetical protein
MLRNFLLLGLVIFVLLQGFDFSALLGGAA